MKKIIKILISAFLFSAVCGTAFAAETFESVCSNLAKHPNMTGNFTQLKTIAAVNRQMKSSGTFIFSLNGIMWKTEKPFPSTMVVGMTSVIQTLANGKQNVIDASSNQVFTSISTTLSAMFSGDAETLKSNFNVDFSVNSGNWKAVLNPKDESVLKILKSISISGTCSASAADLDCIVMLEANGDSIRYDFTDKKYPKELTADEKAFFVAK